MAKSMRSKRLKRLRAIRRDMVEPYYDKKDDAKLAAQEAALAAPKLVVRAAPNAMEVAPTAIAAATTATGAATSITSNMDVEMAGDDNSNGSLKPVGGIGKKSKRQFKMGKGKRRGKGKIRRTRKL